MFDRPDAAQLLTIARETLKPLLDDLPSEHRYSLLMVLNAMAIAARDARAGSARPEVQQLREACGPEYSEIDCDALSDRLAADIRAGAHDGNTRLGQWLLADVRRRLERSNPQYLRMADGASPTKKPSPDFSGDGFR